MRVLLTSVFKPFAVDDEFGSRAINPAELYRHPAISRMQSKELLDAAFRADYERNGPSLYRLMRTMFDRYRQYGRDADVRVRARVNRAAAQLRGAHSAALWAMERYLQGVNTDVSTRIADLRQSVHRELVVASRITAMVGGPLVYLSARREARRHPSGRHLEPQTFIERTNWV